MNTKRAIAASVVLAAWFGAAVLEAQGGPLPEPAPQVPASRWLRPWTAEAAAGVVPALPGLKAFFPADGQGCGGEVYVTEVAAAWIGDEAYRRETPAYRASLVAESRAGNLAPVESDLAPAVLASPDFQIVQALRALEAGRRGRWLGGSDVSGLRAMPGVSVPGEQQGFIAQVVRALDAPTVAWIAGPAEAPFSNRVRFRVGEVVQQHVALVNDRAEPVAVTLSWRAGAAAGAEALTLAPGARRLVPVTFSSGLLYGEIEDRAFSVVGHSGSGDVARSDLTVLRVFGPRPPFRHAPVLLFDPLGESRAMLEGLGVSYELWDPVAALPADAPRRLLVVGKGAFSCGALHPKVLQPYVAGGGRVLVLAQQPAWLSGAQGFRVAGPSRRVFPVSDRHAVIGPLVRDDLRDWRGKPALPGVRPGNVALVSLEKPHHGGWRPILQNGFDLAFSPLLELDYGRGRVVLCTLDLEGTAPRDPAAERLAVNLLNYAAAGPIRPDREALYFGDDETCGRLQALGAVLRHASVQAQVPGNASLAIIGPEAAVSPLHVEAWALLGGTAVVLPGKAAGPWFGATLKASPAFAPPALVADLPEFAGLGLSDVRSRMDRPETVLSAGCELTAGGLIGVRRVGKGAIVYVQVNPWDCRPEEEGLLRLSRWRRTRALCQILANAGVPFMQDAAFFEADGSAVLYGPGPGLPQAP